MDLRKILASFDAVENNTSASAVAKKKETGSILAILESFNRVENDETVEEAAKPDFADIDDEFVGFNTKTGDIQQLLSYDEVCSGRFTHMMNQEEFTYFNPDEEDDMIGSSDEEMEEMGWEKCPAIKNMKYEEKDKEKIGRAHV